MNEYVHADDVEVTPFEAVDPLLVGDVLNLIWNSTFNSRVPDKNKLSTFQIAYI